MDANQALYIRKFRDLLENELRVHPIFTQTNLECALEQDALTLVQWGVGAEKKQGRKRIPPPLLAWDTNMSVLPFMYMQSILKTPAAPPGYYNGSLVRDGQYIFFSVYVLVMGPNVWKMYAALRNLPPDILLLRAKQYASIEKKYAMAVSVVAHPFLKLAQSPSKGDKIMEERLRKRPAADDFMEVPLNELLLYPGCGPEDSSLDLFGGYDFLQGMPDEEAVKVMSSFMGMDMHAGAEMYDANVFASLHVEPFPPIVPFTPALDDSPTLRRRPVGEYCSPPRKKQTLQLNVATLPELVLWQYNRA